MSRRQNTIRIGLEKRSSSRPVLESLEIPQSASSRITICSQKKSCSHIGSPRSGQLSIASSYKELYCTTQTCSNSQSCIQDCPDFCPHGMKEVKEESSKCSETCHSHKRDSYTKPTSTYSASYDPEVRDSKSPSGCNDCATEIPITTIRETSSLGELFSSCFKSNKSEASPPSSPTKSTSSGSLGTRSNLPNEQLSDRRTPKDKFSSSLSTQTRKESSDRPLNQENSHTGKCSLPSSQPINRPRSKVLGGPITDKKSPNQSSSPSNHSRNTLSDISITQQDSTTGRHSPTQIKQTRINLSAQQLNRKTTSGGELSPTRQPLRSSLVPAGKQSKSVSTDIEMDKPPLGSKCHGVNAETNPMPNTTSTSTQHPSINPNLGNIKYVSDLQREESKTSPLSSSPTEESKSCCAAQEPLSSVTDPRKKTSFQTPLIETDNNTKPEKEPCPCSQTKTLPPVPKKCSCHFPPAFNQYGCTGNISGNCNCGSDD